MKTKNRSRKSTSIAQTRWISYVAAGAATALSANHSAEAAIHYSAPINSVFRGDETDFSFISVASDFGIMFIHFSNYAGFAVYSFSLGYRGVRGISHFSRCVSFKIRLWREHIGGSLCDKHNLVFCNIGFQQHRSMARQRRGIHWLQIQGERRCS